MGTPHTRQQTPTLVPRSSKSEVGWEVVPFVPLPPRSRFAFTYRAPAELPIAPGMLVRIPFGKRTVSGIVLRRATGRIPVWKLKTMTSTLSRAPLFSAVELAMLQELAELSLESFPLLVQSATRVRSPIAKGDHMLPPQTQKKTSKHSFRIDVQWRPLAHILTTPPRNQTLLLIPETSVARAAIALLDSKKIPWVFFTQTLPLRERRAILHRLLAGEALVVIATHPGIFLPLPALARIIVAEAALPSHRQWDLHPRYDARIGAFLRAKAQNVPVTFQSTLPSLDLARMSPPVKQGALLSSPIRVLPRMSTDPLISSPLLSAIRDTIERGGNVFVFHNIVGNERAFVCKSCGALLTCPECGDILERVRSQLRCRTCDAARGPVLRFCPRCQSPHLVPRHIGTASITETLRHAVPDATILQADRHTLPRTQRGTRALPRTRTEAFPFSLTPKRHILVGTERAFSVLGTGHLFDLVIVLDADRLLEAPSFDAAERLVATVARLAQHRRNAEPLLLATTHNHQSVIRALETDLRSWIDAELADRQLLAYPPAAALIRLERIAPSVGRARESARKLLARLRSSAPDIRSGFRIIERPQPHAEILLRGSLKDLSAALQIIPAGWNMDPLVPVSLLTPSLS